MIIPDSYLLRLKLRVKESYFWPLLYKSRSIAQLGIWYLTGRPNPPPHIVKRRAVKHFARLCGMKVFVETGTYLGDMVDAVRRDFERIYSIELGQELAQLAMNKFSPFEHIKICQGDSSKQLALILDEISEPCLFWLDAHFSSGITSIGDTKTPIREELEEIFKHPLSENHVILIDDARCFTGFDDYPSLDQIYSLASQAGFGTIEVQNDIIRIHN